MSNLVEHSPLPSRHTVRNLIEDLIERGHAYGVEGDVYFAVRSVPSYGELSGRDVDAMDENPTVMTAH